MSRNPSIASTPVPGISGATRLVGLIGWPVAHSLSPRLHNAAYAALGLDWAYVPLPVSPGRVGGGEDPVRRAVRGLAALGFAGANVTVPYKEAVIPFLDELTPVATAVGAVNTIIVRPDGLLWGDTTDGAGFMADLRSHWPLPAFNRVLLLGAGGAARAVAYALIEAGCEVAIVNRTLERAEELRRTVAMALPAAAARLGVHRFPDAIRDLAGWADLVVNATALGLHEADPAPWDPAVPFRPGQVVYDLIYNRPTALMALAESHGAAAIGGLGMLIHQGARSAALWTGQDEGELARLMRKELGAL